MGLSTGPEHLQFWGHVKGRYGNAILSSFPIQSTIYHHLRGGSEVSFTPGTLKLNGQIAQPGEVHRLARGMLEVLLELPGGVGLTVACTHLDHMSIEQRRVQLEHVVSLLDQSEISRPVLLVGDLNALTRSDYTDAHWTNLCTRAESKGWSPPESGVDLDVLTSRGYKDASSVLKTCSLTAPVGHPLYRIDYCFYKGSGIVPVFSEVPLIEHSDHYPLVVDLNAESSDSTGLTEDT